MDLKQIDRLAEELRGSIIGAPATPLLDFQQRYEALSLIRSNESPIEKIFAAYAQVSYSNEPVNRKDAEAAVADIYTKIGRSTPIFIWFDSPLNAAMAANIILLQTVRDSLPPSERVEDMPFFPLRDAFRECRRNGLDRAITIKSINNPDEGNPIFFALSQIHDHVSQTPPEQFSHHDARIITWLFNRWTDGGMEFTEQIYREFPRAQLPYQATFDWLDLLSNYERHHVITSALGWTLDQRTNRVLSLHIGRGDAWPLAMTHAAMLFGMPAPPGFDAFRETMWKCGWWWPFEQICIMCERPTSLVFANGGLHADSEAAAVYPDGFKMYFYRNRPVPRSVALGEFSIAEIESENNVEMRRLMIERYGLERYILEGGAQRVQSDEVGILYRKEQAGGDEPLVVVCVKNSTPEPDGSYKDYFLRVPPTIMTARDAIAWTFAMDGRDYKPATET